MSDSKLYEAAVRVAAELASLRGRLIHNSQDPAIEPDAKAVTEVCRRFAPDFGFELLERESYLGFIVKLIDTITAFGWQNIGVVFHDPDFEDDKDNFELKATMAGINVVMSVGIPGEFDASQSWRTSLPLSLLQASGARIVVAFLRTSPLDLGP